MSKTEYYSKAQAYHKYRWEYSIEAINYILKAADVENSTVIVDVGAGTGKLTKHFDNYVDKLYAVEPDTNMLEILSISLQNAIPLKRFSDDIPEIPSNSVHVIVSAHALHWFLFEKTILEFNRIASNKCCLFSIENQNIFRHSLFDATGELIERYTIKEVQSKHDHKNITNYFLNKEIQEKSFEYIAKMDFEVYFGSLLSTSFLPSHQDGNFHNFKNDASSLFEKYVLNGIVNTKIKTTVRCGQLAPPPPG